MYTSSRVVDCLCQTRLPEYKQDSDTSQALYTQVLTRRLPKVVTQGLVVNLTDDTGLQGGGPVW